MKIGLFILLLSTCLITYADSSNTSRTSSRCSDPNRKSSLDCQIEAYKSAVASCKNQVNDCNSEISSAFKNLETQFPLCLNPKESEELSLDIPYATKEECAKLEKFVVSQVVPSNPSYLEIGRALKFINQRVQLKTAQK